MEILVLASVIRSWIGQFSAARNSSCRDTRSLRSDVDFMPHPGLPISNDGAA
jgi:hypothetical protein